VRRNRKVWDQNKGFGSEGGGMGVCRGGVGRGGVVQRSPGREGISGVEG